MNGCVKSGRKVGALSTCSRYKKPPDVLSARGPGVPSFRSHGVLAEEVFGASYLQALKLSIDKLRRS